MSISTIKSISRPLSLHPIPSPRSSPPRFKRTSSAIPLKCWCGPSPKADSDPKAFLFGISTSTWCASLGALGFVETAYLSYVKLSGSEAFCAVGGGGCDDVLNSEFSYVFGVPLPLIGLISYGLVTLLSLQQSGKNLISGFGESDVRFLLLGTTTSMATASAYFLYLLGAKLPGSSCSYCLISVFLSFSLLFITLKDYALEEIQKVIGLQLAIVAIVVATLSNSYTMASSKFPGSSDITLEPYETEIIEQSTPWTIALAKHLHSIGAKMYGAFWCSHCMEQKQMFGREAAKTLDYIECFPDGVGKGRKMTQECKLAGLEGFPTWIIKGKSWFEKGQEAAFADGGIIRSGREILFQGFNWESHKNDWWSNLEKKVPDLAEAGFTSVWLSPATHSFSPEGYLPQNLYSLDSAYGSEHQLKALLQKLSQHKIRAMADIVINHRVGTSQGHGGAYNRFEGIPVSWDEHAITSCSGGLGNQSTGCNFPGVPNIDHTQPFVRKDIVNWLKWLRESIKFQDFRFDFAKGYDSKFVREYIEQSKPVFSVGEYWDSCSYDSGNHLDYNQDNHRQRIINWIDSAGGLCAAFDFTTKGILQEAVKRELWRLRDPQEKPPGVVGWWPSRAITFIENHDTGSTQGHWPFPSDHIMEGYAYILTHPGIPAVFYDHFYDWGKPIHDQIVKLMDIRRHHDIHSRSTIRILESQSDLYAAIIGDKVCVKIGDGSWCPTDGEWKLETSGIRYAAWCR